MISHIDTSAGKLSQDDKQICASLQAGPTRHMDWSGLKDRQYKADKFISFGAAADVILHSRKPKAIEPAEVLGINTKMHKYILIGQETILTKIKVFKGAAFMDL